MTPTDSSPDSAHGRSGDGTADAGSDLDPDRCYSDFGLTWGETDDTIWLRNDDGDYKRVHPSFLEPLLGLARGDRDPATADPKVLRTIDLLADEGYLEPGGTVTRYETPSDVRLWPRVAVFCVLTLATCALIVARWDVVWTPPGSFAGTLVVIPFFLVATAVHELGHVVAARPYFRARVRFGRLNGVIPAVITRTTDAWQCPRNVRLWISLAGPFVDVVVTFALAVALMVSPDRTLLGTLILIQCFRFLFVLNPLIDGDGYWLLVDAFGEHNLRKRAFRDLKGGRPTLPAVFAASIVVFTGGFVLASAYFLAHAFGLTASL